MHCSDYDDDEEEVESSSDEECGISLIQIHKFSGTHVTCYENKYLP